MVLTATKEAVKLEKILCGTLLCNDIEHYIGRGGRFGRGVSLYHYRSQLFVRFVGTIPTADRAVF